MADRDSHVVESRGIGNVQAGRNSFGPIRRTLLTVAPRASQVHDNKRSGSPALESLKQWELVEGDRGLRVVEKKFNPPTVPIKSVKSYAAPVPPVRAIINDELARKFKAFERSSIVQVIPAKMDDQDSKAPISLNAILKQTGDTRCVDKSIDVLDKLERQVKAIEMNTIANKSPAILQNSCDLQSEIQLRYREHEDLLNNVTDDEAEG